MTLGFPANVGLIVSGHMHRFQAMGFISGGPPPQLIVGTGGVGLSKTFPKDPFTFTFADAAVATGVGLSEFGLLRIDVGERGAWTAKLQDINDNTLAECTSAWASARPAQAVCTLNSRPCQRAVLEQGDLDRAMPYPRAPSKRRTPPAAPRAT